MTRNRQASRTVHLASPGVRRPYSRPFTFRPRRLRRLILTAGLAVAALLIAQVVAAAPPTANFTINGSTAQSVTVSTGSTVTLASTSTDPDDDIATYQWDFDYDGNFSADASGQTATTNYGTAGSYSVALLVTDGMTGDTTADPALRVKTVNVQTPNTNPTGSFTFTPEGEADGAVADVGQQISFSASGQDGDGDPITFEWNFGDGETAIGPTATHAFSTAGPRNVTLTVRDNRGGTGGQTRQVTVNSPPVARLGILNDAAEPGQLNSVPLAGQAFAFTAGAVPALQAAPPAPGCPALLGSPASAGSSDAAPGTITKYEWDLDGNGSFETDTGAQNVAPSPVNGYAAGPHTVGLRVTDNDGSSRTATLDFRVNRPPTSSFVYEPFTPVINQSVIFSSTATDLDGADTGHLTYSWDLDNDGTFCEAGERGASVERAFATANTSPGHRVRLRVTDTGGITREIARMIVVQNTVPTGAISFEPGAPLPGQPVTFTGSASSPAGKAIAGMQWDFSFDPSTDQFDVDGTGGSVTHSFSTPGPKLVGLRVQEAGGGFAIVTRTVNVNAPPHASFSIAPTSAFTNETVTLSSTSSDPDGPLVKQEWDLDNDGQFDDANAAVVSARFLRPRSYPLKLRVTDARGASAVATGRVVVKRRPLPVLADVSFRIGAQRRTKSVKITELSLTAPKGAKATVRCIGRGCPAPVAKRSKGVSKRLAFGRFKKVFRSRVKFIVTVTKRGFIGKQKTYLVRPRGVISKRPLCLTPGAKRAKRCPTTR
jgi:PKD repeat protein